MLNSILMVPGPPERLNKLKNRFFEKSDDYDDDEDDENLKNLEKKSRNRVFFN